ncbi:DUF6691 family protein [Luteibaculum oceani]|uniref:YeeE/YedE family protein n=1 Tax=Luteibaculum oceani TaxID=1294296 RepID=A0A5C6UUE8_9FLAO|nr:DUF6691 family protein [Luteibaculum oceani]TXC76250.1 YeeE/YedE family protein [Luteibaculum oceani]
MKYFKFLLIGILFGIIMVKSQAVSWYRIQEMFRFQSFHMYGIIGSALAAGLVFNQLFRRNIIRSFRGNPIQLKDKAPLYKANILGGILFGMGWGITGACPGPLYTLFGAGYTSIILVIISAISGTFLYGVLKKHLPH